MSQQPMNEDESTRQICRCLYGGKCWVEGEEERKDEEDVVAEEARSRISGNSSPLNQLE